MKYHVECELLSLNANSPELPTLDASIFNSPQAAVDHARQWVSNFNGAVASGLPRASVTRRGKFKGLAVIFNCWRKPNGEICERRNVEATHAR